MRGRMPGTWLSLVVAVLVVAFLAGCAGKQKKEAEFWEYAMPEGKALEYRKAEDVVQQMEVMGQAMEMSFNKEIGFSMMPVAGEGTDLEAEVTITSLEASMSSAQGDFDADGDPAIGESFAMTLSRLGREIDVSGAGEIKYSQGPQGDRSLHADFAGFFPDLPGTPVKPGDTWTSKDEIPVSEGGTDLIVVSERMHTLLGFETIDGMKCAEVEAAITGTITGEGEQMGMPLTFTGTMEGTETWYFAVEEGVFVKSSSNIVTTATVTVSGPQEMVIPMTMNMTMEIELLK